MITPRDEQVIEWLEAKPLTVVELSDKLEISIKGARNRIKHLRDNGRHINTIKCAGGWKYEIKKRGAK